MEIERDMRKILLSSLALATLAVGSAACGSKSSGGSPPSFNEPTGSEIQIDRMGRPAINTILKKVFDTGGQTSDAFNQLSPAQDLSVAGGTSGILARTISFAHACPAPAIALALLPDVLTFNIASNANYAQLNGRGLTDDVFDATLFALYQTNGAAFCNGTTSFVLAGDHINANDVPLAGLPFPFLAAPH
jgi:hypothetical protein